MENRDLVRLGRICRTAKYLVLLLTVLSAIISLIFVGLLLIAVITPDFSDADYTREEFAVAACLMSTLAVTLTFSLYNIFRITKSLGESKTPFTMENRKHLCNISIALALAAVLAVAEGGASYLMGYAPDSGILILVSLLLISSVSVYVLALVFEYGIRLQTESDSFV